MVKTKEDAHFRLRLPIDLKERIEELASFHERSINSQVIVLIKEALIYEEITKKRLDKVERDIAFHRRVNGEFLEKLNEFSKRIDSLSEAD